MQVVRLFGQLDVGADVTWNIQHLWEKRWDVLTVSVDVPEIQLDVSCINWYVVCENSRYVPV